MKNKSLLSNDKLVITFNFKNEPVTVPTSEEFDEIEKSSDIEAFASPNKSTTMLRGAFISFWWLYAVDRLAHRANATQIIP